MRIDPICGAVVNELNAHYSEYDGMMFYFCSRSCRNIYISTHISGAVREKQYAYICPLHAEIKQECPGECTKCGRTLESASFIAKDDHWEEADFHGQSSIFWLGVEKWNEQSERFV